MGKKAIDPMPSMALSFHSMSERRNDEPAISAASKSKLNRDTLKMILAVVFPTLALISILIVRLLDVSTVLAQFNTAHSTLEQSLAMKTLIGNFQQERSVSTLYIASGMDAKVRNNFQEVMTLSNQGIRELHKYISKSEAVFYRDDKTVTLGDITTQVAEHRGKVLNKSIAIEDNIMFYSHLNKALIDSMTAIVVIPHGDRIWKKYVSISNLLPVTEADSIQKSIGSEYFPTCNISAGFMKWFKELDTTSTLLTEMVFPYSPDLIPLYQEKLAEIKDIQERITILKEQQLLNRSYDKECLEIPFEQRLANGMLWYEYKAIYVTQYLDLLKQTTKDLTLLVTDAVYDSRMSFAAYTCIGTLITGASIVLLVWYTRCINILINKIIKQAEAMSEKTKEVCEEKKRTERLLYQVLPKSVAGETIKPLC